MVNHMMRCSIRYLISTFYAVPVVGRVGGARAEGGGGRDLTTPTDPSRTTHTGLDPSPAAAGVGVGWLSVLAAAGEGEGAGLLPVWGFRFDEERQGYHLRKTASFANIPRYRSVLSPFLEPSHEIVNNRFNLCLSLYSCLLLLVCCGWRSIRCSGDGWAHHHPLKIRKFKIIYNHRYTHEGRCQSTHASIQTQQMAKHACSLIPLSPSPFLHAPAWVWV
jgi:hypothetical protein